MFFQDSNIAARILVIRPGALGDTILAFPALQALAATCRRARMELVGYPSVLCLVEHAVPSMPIGAIHSIDRSLFAPLFSGPLSAALEAFLVSYDLVVAWVHDRDGELHRKVKALPNACLCADPYPPDGSKMHASQHLLETLAPLRERLSGDESLCIPRVQAPPAALVECEGILRRQGLGERGFIAMHPGSGSARKNWPAAKFAALMRIAESAGRRVVVLEGESDGEAVSELRGKLRGSGGETFSHIRRPSLLTLAAILSRAGAFVGNDSGVSHLAAATGTPTLTLFGPTDAAIWAPQGPRAFVRTFQTPVAELWVQLDRLLASAGETPHN